jgi:NAD(P)-dependent dehydrogenase (short-subunit alcohol dehydrogenase family)
MYDFSDQVIVVTGAAGNLGSAVVKAFLAGKGTVCGLDHRQGRMEEYNNNTSTSGRFFPYENVDLTDREALMRLADKIEIDAGKISVVVNTVGGFTSGERVDELSDSTWQRMMAINVYSVLNAAAAFVPKMMENGRGKFIAIGSRASLNGSAKTGAYSAAKAAVLRLIESMSAELKPSNIQANCVLPGTIDTPDNRKAMPDADTSKWVSPEQIAGVIQFLASPAADAISGAAVPVYGG